MEKLILSIDAGASSTKYAVLNVTNKKVLKEYTANACFFAFNNIEKMKQELDHILAIVKSDYPNLFAIFAGISGIDSGEDTKKFKLETKLIFQKYFPTTPLRIFNDVDFLLMFSSSLNKIALISGTGSNCIGINGKQVTAKAGGLGAILANQGSGYYIGLKALQNALKSYDGRGIKTKLEKEILKKYKSSDLSKIKESLQTSKNYQKEIAELTRLVAICEKKGDIISKNILDEAVYELFLHVKAVEKKLFPNEYFEIVASGNVFSIDYIKHEFQEHVVNCFGINSKIIFLDTPHYVGPINFNW